VAGKYSAESALTTDACIDCGAGKYSDAGATEPVPCTFSPTGPVSYYSAQETGSSSCIACPAGKETNANIYQAADCTDCDAGSYSEAGDTCTQCHSGSHLATAGTAKTDCIACSADGSKYTSDDSVATQDSDCIACEAGKHSDFADCSDADVAATTCTITCDNCEAGKASATVGANSDSTCIDCDQGSYAAAASTECTDCTSGQYGEDNACINCAAGKIGIGVKQVDFASACIACDAGKTSNAGDGADSGTGADCTDCSAGQYGAVGTGEDASLGDLGTCSDCGEGKYGTGGAAECIACPAGTGAGEGSGASSDCADCGAGKYSLNAGDSFGCQYCDGGGWSAETAQVDQSNCKECPNGRFRSTGGTDTTGEATELEACLACPTGKMSVFSYVELNAINPERNPQRGTDAESVGFTILAGGRWWSSASAVDADSGCLWCAVWDSLSCLCRRGSHLVDTLSRHDLTDLT
jgi:hypothetical protein